MYLVPFPYVFLWPLIGPQIKWSVKGLSLVNPPSLPYPPPCHWLTDWLTDPLVKISLRRLQAQTLKIVVPVIKQTIFTFFLLSDSKSWRASKSLYWFKSYGGFTEWVEFAYWWSCIGKGLRLQPAQEACFYFCQQPRWLLVFLLHYFFFIIPTFFYIL